MEIAFYIAATIAVLATIMVITRYNMIHALLYLVVSFLAVAVVFLTMGAPFMAALEVIVYAGAIVVLIIFVIMMLSLTREDVEQEKAWLQPKLWMGPALLSFVLLAELVYLLVIAEMPAAPAAASYVDAKAVGLALYGPYILGVQLAGILLMAGIVGAYHLGRQKKKVIHRFLQEKEPQKERSAVL